MMHAMQDDDCHMLSLRSTPQSVFYNLPTPITFRFAEGQGAILGERVLFCMVLI